MAKQTTYTEIPEVKTYKKLKGQLELEQKKADRGRRRTHTIKYQD